jgi:hypothetical protein
MRAVRDTFDLGKLQRGKRGYILNDRADGARLHRVDCEAVGAMNAAAYPKIFLDDYDEAVAWSNQNKRGWDRCGRCHTWSSNQIR